MLGMGCGCLATVSEWKFRQFGTSADTLRGRVFPIPPKWPKNPRVYPPLTISQPHHSPKPAIYSTSNVPKTKRCECSARAAGGLPARQNGILGRLGQKPEHVPWACFPHHTPHNHRKPGGIPPLDRFHYICSPRFV